MINERVLYRKRNKVSITNKTYATMYNRFLDRATLKGKKYPIELAIEHDGVKGPRPIIILWSHEKSDKIIATSLTTSTSQYNAINHFPATDGSCFKHEVLVFSKHKTIFINNHVWKRYSKDEVDEFLNWWKNSKDKKSYTYLQILINKYDNEVKDKIIKELLESGKQ